MLKDWGSWDGAFNTLTASVCRDLVDIVNGRDEHVCVPLQGSGTFAVEAALGTLVPESARRCSCRITAATASASCAFSDTSAVRPSCWRTASRSLPNPRASMRRSRPITGDHATLRRCTARPVPGFCNPTGADRNDGRQARPGPHRRCNEFLWRAPHRRTDTALRCAGGGLWEMP